MVVHDLVNHRLGALQNFPLAFVRSLEHLVDLGVLLFELLQVLVADNLFDELLELALQVFELVWIEAELFQSRDLLLLVLDSFDIQVCVLFVRHLSNRY